VTLVPNIGPREVAKRRRFGVIALAVALAAGAILVVSDVSLLLRLLLFLPLYLAGLGFLQAQDRT
jgi:hypothetical protein